MKIDHTFPLFCRQPSPRNYDEKEGIDGRRTLGYCHISFSVGNKESVDSLTARLEAEGFKIIDGLRTTIDMYYESLVEGFDGNLIEITM